MSPSVSIPAKTVLQLQAISSLVRRVYRAMTVEVPLERSRVSGGNSSNVEEELSRNFQIPRVGAQRKFKVALNPMYRIFLNFAKSCVLSCLSKVDNIKKFHRAVFEL